MDFLNQKGEFCSKFWRGRACLIFGLEQIGYHVWTQKHMKFWYLGAAFDILELWITKVYKGIDFAVLIVVSF